MEVNGTILVQILVFVSLLVLLSNTLFSPILRLFEEREKRIEGAKLAGQKLRAEADLNARKFESEFNKARHDLRAELAKFKEETDKKIEASLLETKMAEKQKIKLAQEQLEKEKAILKAELATKSDLLAEEILAKLAANS